MFECALHDPLTFMNIDFVQIFFRNSLFTLKMCWSYRTLLSFRFTHTKKAVMDPTFCLQDTFPIISDYETPGTIESINLHPEFEVLTWLESNLGFGSQIVPARPSIRE